jgi:alkanesulfonate monooxygenase
MRRRPEPRFDWFIPIDGDGAHIGMRRAERPPTFEYLRRVVETAEAEGYYSLLIPTRFANGLFEETAPLAETWTTVTALAAVTRRIRFLVAVRPGFISTGLFAQMAAALDQISGGRLDLNVVPGGIQGDFERLGVTMDHDKRYEQAEEFIAALRALWAKPEPVVFEGSTIRLKGAVVSPGPVGDAPRFCVGGASPRALQFTAREADALPGVDPAGGRHPRPPGAAAKRPRVHGTASFPRAADAPGRTAHRARGVAGGGRVAGGRARRCPAPDGVRRYPDGRPAGAAPGARAGEGARLWNGISRVRVNLGTAIVGDPAQVNVAPAVLPGLREAIRRES